MSNHFSLVEWSIWDARGFRSSTNLPTPSHTLPASIREIKWKAISSSPFDKFGRLDITSKLAIVLTECLKSSTADLKSSGILYTTTTGSVESDIEYLKSLQDGFPSPKLFTYTLPSIPAAEVSIRHGIAGPVKTCPISAFDIRTSLLLGQQLIEDHSLDTVLCIHCDIEYGPAAPKHHDFGAAFLVSSMNQQGILSWQADQVENASIKIAQIIDYSS